MTCSVAVAQSSEVDRIRYRCGACGDIHRGLPDVSFAAPLDYYRLEPHERVRRAVLSREACVIDEERFFSRARLAVPVAGEMNTFAWLVWCRIAEHDFWPLWQARHEGMCDAGDVSVRLANRLPGYPDTMGVTGRLEAVGNGELPHLHLLGDHPLSQEQSGGIEADKAFKLAQGAGARMVFG